MNYITETSFMELYEELSVLNEEAEIAQALSTSNAVSSNTLDQILQNYVNELKTACQKSRGIAQNVIILLAEPFSRSICDTGSIARSCLAFSDKREWHYIDMTHPCASSENRYKYAEMLANSEIDLTNSWVVFNFIQDKTDSQAVANELALALGLPKDLATFVRPCKAFGSSIYKAGAVCGVAFPYTPEAGKSTLLNFCSLTPKALKNIPLSVSTDVADNVVQLDDFKQAKEFIEKFSKEYPNRIQYISDRPSAIHVPSLVNFYIKYPDAGATIRSMLSTYFKSVTLEPNPLQPHKSVQYLYNAIQQEHVMKSILQPNSAATNAGAEVADSHQYLISGVASSATDFVYRNLTIDAKQGHYKKGAIAKINNSHNANYIVYFAYEGLGSRTLGLHDIEGSWLLYRAIPGYANFYNLVSKPTSAAEKQLLDLLGSLTNKLTLVNLKTST
jgi:hypothetical protein